jgi:hypothetical protein
MKRIILATLGLLIHVALISQHDQHHGHKPLADAVGKKKDTIPSQQHQHDSRIGSHDKHDTHEGNMSHAFSKNLPMTRNGSGTAWLPDSSPMYAYMFHTPKWMYMIHGSVFLRYNKQDLFDEGSRGDAKLDIPNMWMFMGQRNVGAKGLFHFSSMLSLDLITVGKSGYPLLFQTGETYKGQPLIDRQHPHGSSL